MKKKESVKKKKKEKRKYRETGENEGWKKRKVMKRK